MYLNHFSVRIPEGNETSGGYVELFHGTQYTLVLRNANDQPCDARVEVDGKHVGTWRLNAKGSVRLERPAHDHSKFTFYKLDSVEAQSAALNGNDPNLGLVKVVFTPGQEVPVYRYVPPAQPLTPQWTPPEPQWTYTDTRHTAEAGATYCAVAACGEGAQPKSLSSPTASVYHLSAGGTGLSGYSGQEFWNVEPLNYNYNRQTTIFLRLVCKNGNEPRPLISFSTPVPPPVR